jgi:hypothetical protein
MFMRRPKDEHEEKVISDVKKNGLSIMHVLGDEEYPRFSYSIGLFENYLHPEILIIGLKHDLAQILINNMAHDIKHGKVFTAKEYHEDVLDNFLCYFDVVPKSEYKDHVGWAIWFYEGTDFPLIQCVYPTVEGKFPWDKDFPKDAEFFCQMLIDPPREH